jgi:hypothetical protein
MVHAATHLRMIRHGLLIAVVDFDTSIMVTEGRHRSRRRYVELTIVAAAGNYSTRYVRCISSVDDSIDSELLLVPTLAYMHGAYVVSASCRPLHLRV